MFDLNTLNSNTLDINTLRQVPLFAQLPDTRLQWLIEQGYRVMAGTR
jgi:hypothetical protein